MTPTESPSAELTALVVEDDSAVRDALRRGLELHGFTVVSVPDAERATRELSTWMPQVIVLDVGLPGMSGIELCERIRRDGIEVPVLILSARDQVHDRVAGLEAGADDYLVKPFDLTELVLRLRALLRRVGARTPSSAQAVGALRLDDAKRIVTLGGARLDLSRREFDLLSTFMQHPEIVLSRTQLLERVWGYDFEVDTNVVDVFVGYLRRKFEAAGGERMIETVRGVGYVLRAA